MDAVVAKLGSGVDGRVKLLLLDVTSQESVDQAFQIVSAEHGTIYGVLISIILRVISCPSECKGDQQRGGYGRRAEEHDRPEHLWSEASLRGVCPHHPGWGKDCSG